MTTINTEERNSAPQSEKVGMLLALNRTKPFGAIFQGVPAHVKAKRRAAGKRAKAARKASR